MAFYTGQSQLNLPRTPDSYTHHFTMNAATAALPSIRAAEFLNWSTWRASSSKHPHDSSTSTPLTPPMTSTFQSRMAYTSSSTGHIQPLPAPSIPVDEMELDDEESEDEEEEEERYEVVPEHEDESRMTLPPIAHLERHLHNLPPLTPPDDIPHHQIPPRIALPKIATTHTDAEFFQAKHMAVPMVQYNVDQSTSTHTISTSATSKEYYHDPSHLAPLSTVNTHQPSSSTTDASETHGVTPNTSAAAATTITTLALAPAPPSYLVDWLDFTRTRSAHFVAEKTCEMICYLWFSIPSHAKKSVDGSPTPGLSSLEDHKSSMNSATSLQLIATPAFVSFLQKLLETTQVSQSVIVLSLHYIHRLKEKNRYMPAQPGSEFRIAVAGLMMANKFLDDNTYTNKTWAEVSGISLDEINRMEREFLLGVDFNLYVDKTTYASWLNLLKGLVLAKERDARRLLRGSTHGSRGASSARRAAAAVAASSFRTGRDRDGKVWHPHQPPTQHYQQQAAHGGYQNQSYVRPHLGAPAHASSGPTSRIYTTPAAAANAISQSTSSSTRSYRHRARSTSPQAFTFSSNASRVVSHPSAYTNRDAESAFLHTQTPQSPEQSAHAHQVSILETHPRTPSSPTPSSSLQNVHSTPSTGSKRSAAAAFASPSPSSPAHSFHAPAYASKRQAPYGDLHSLQIPDFSGSACHRSNTGSGSVGTNDPSPLEGLHGFERMTLAVPHVDNSEGDRGREHLRRRERSERDGRIEDTRQAKRRLWSPLTLLTLLGRSLSPRTFSSIHLHLRQTLTKSNANGKRVSNSASFQWILQKPRWTPMMSLTRTRIRKLAKRVFGIKLLNPSSMDTIMRI
ncbi:cyclin-domain-containing protein [Crepidotus variabilis]|uniref:Cyclin-domain-containing protein n=1 Tax=Crepidotus variabilis TaxID=179855 RepID=A0A9P6EFC9_9AGAR|nr:cyclin-domain-containing protein [Crepidotus variabilis]